MKIVVDNQYKYHLVETVVHPSLGQTKTTVTEETCTLSGHSFLQALAMMLAGDHLYSIEMKRNIITIDYSNKDKLESGTIKLTLNEVKNDNK